MLTVPNKNHPPLASLVIWNAQPIASNDRSAWEKSLKQKAVIFAT